MSEFIDRSKDPAGCAACDEHFGSSAKRSTPGARNVTTEETYRTKLGGAPQSQSQPNRDYFDMFDSGSGTNYKRDLGTGHHVK